MSRKNLERRRRKARIPNRRVLLPLELVLYHKAETFYAKSLSRCADQFVPIKAAHTGKDRSRHYEDFLRIRIFNLAPGRVSADVDQASVGIEWIVDKTGFPWDRFRQRKLRLI
jgi:hypothetical protein